MTPETQMDPLGGHLGMPKVTLTFISLSLAGLWAPLP